MLVLADGTIPSNTDSIDRASADDCDVAFERWLPGAHADVHRQMTWIDIGGTVVAGATAQPVVAGFCADLVEQSEVCLLGG